MSRRTSTRATAAAFDTRCRRPWWRRPLVLVSATALSMSSTLGAVSASGATGQPTTTVSTADGAAVSFGQPIVSPVGDPTSLAAADLDGDGHPDLAVTGTGPSGVSILPGNGSGFFPTVWPHPLSGTPSSVTVDDLDSDDTPDLAVTDSDDNEVEVLLGNGDATFVDRSSSLVGTAPDSVASGDLDGDQLTDLVTSNAGSDDASVLLGQGDGTFRAQTPVPVGTNPSGDDVADFDGDGHLDAVVSNSDSGSVSVLLGDGDGSFQQPVTTYAAGSAPSSVSAGDLNDDGISDLAVTDAGTDSVVLLPGVGDGTFSAPSTESTSDGGGQDPVSVSEQDLDGDGHVDLAVASANGVVSLLQGDGTGGFTAAPTLEADGPISWLVTADFDTDQRPDLAVSTDSGVNVFLNQTTFPLSRPVTGPSQQSCGHHATLTGELRATAYRTRWSFEWWHPHRRHHHTRMHTVPPDDDPQPVTTVVRHLRPRSVVVHRLVAVSHGVRTQATTRRVHLRRHCPAS